MSLAGIRTFAHVLAGSVLGGPGRGASRRLLFVLLLMAAMWLALLAPPSSQASQRGNDVFGKNGRIPGLGDFKRYGNTTYTYLPRRGEYEVRTPGKPRSYMHGDPKISEGVTGTADEEISGEGGVGSHLPTSELEPVCRSSGRRVVVIYSHRAEDPNPIPAETIRSWVRRMNWKIADQSSQSSDGERVVQMAVDCDEDGEISVYDLTTSGNEHGEINFTVKKELFGAPMGDNAIKYLAFDSEPHPNGYSGLANITFGDTNKNETNVAARVTYLAVTYRPYEDKPGHTPIHELFHTLGAVNGWTPPGAPFAASSHCIDGLDVMCYPTPPYTYEGLSYSEKYCPVSKGYWTPATFPIDCNNNTYFDAAPTPDTYLDEYWNIAGPENPFLIAPSKAETEAASLVAARSASLHGTVNPEGYDVSYHFEYGTTEAYGSSTPSESFDFGADPVAVEDVIEGLKPNTTYHYRVVAESDVGTSKGEDETFTTALDPRFSSEFGSFGSGNGQLNFPSGIATDPEGDIWVADTLNHRLQRFDPEGKYPAHLGGFGTEDGQFNGPYGVAVDSSGNVWVADTENNRIQKFDPEGEYLFQFGSEGSEEGEFRYPKGIATDSAGNVWVADTENHRIQKFDSTGKYLAQFGSYGSGNGQFSLPSGIVTDSAGNVWVADTFHHRIQKFDSTGKYLAQFGSYGSGNGEFIQPTAIATDSAGNVWVADAGNDRIQGFNAAGEYLTQFGETGTGEGQLESPYGIATGPEGDIWVADTGNLRVQKWVYLVPAATTEAASTVMATQATLHATVNPTASDTTYRFEYDTAEYKAGDKPHGTSTPIPSKSIGSGSEDVVVSQTPTGLSQNTVYHYRVVAESWLGTSYGEEMTLKTLKLPKATTEAVSSEEDRATLNATVNPEGFETTYHFEYDTTAYEGAASHGTSVPLAGETIGSGTSNVEVSEAIEELEFNTTYHFRIVATSAGGTTYGEDETFTTAVDKRFSLAFGSFGSGNGQLNFPSGIATDPEGDIWVADTLNHRLQRFDPEGKYPAHLGGFGTEDGQFNGPYGVAVDSSGNVWVADTENNRIQKFDPEGEYLFQFGSEGSEEGEFRYPKGIATDSAGNVWVADTENHRIQKFDSEGKYISQFGGSGSGNGKLSLPSGIAIDSTGNVWVADSGNHRIQKFKANGEYLAQVGKLGSGNGEFIYPTGIATDPAGNVWVADTGNDRVQKFDSTGKYLTQFGAEGSGAGNFHNPSGIAIDSAGDLWVTDAGNGRVQKWSPYDRPAAVTEPATDVDAEGATLNATIDPNGSETDYHFEYGTAAYEGAASHGTSVPVPAETLEVGSEVEVSEELAGLQAGETYHFRIVASNELGTSYGTDESFTAEEAADSRFDFDFGEAGTANGQLDSAVGIATDSSGNIWVADTENNRIQKFNSEGKYISQFGGSGSGNGKLSLPSGIAIDSSGNVWVADCGNDRIQKFKASGEYISQFGSSGSGDGQFECPTGIAFDSSGRAFVVDNGNNRVQKFKATGEFLAKFGSKGSGNGQFNSPHGVGLDTKGRIWVVDSNNDRVQRFSPSTLGYQKQFGTQGTGNGQFEAPIGITVDVAGRLWVSDGGNSRLQRFDDEGTYIEQLGTEGSGAGQFFTPRGLAVPSSWGLLIVDGANHRVQRWTLVPDAPVATTEAATEVKSTSATLNATINPNSLATTYRFEYGKTPSYGTSIPIPDEAIGSGQSGVKVSKAISGLASGTKYHFRIVAINASGTTYGVNKALTTP